MRVVQWTSTTVKKALQLRFARGASGYNLLLMKLSTSICVNSTATNGDGVIQSWYSSPGT